MKKLLLIITLVLPSFFFIFTPNVKADTYVYEISSDELNFLNSSAFLTLREETIKFCNDNNKKYIIYCGSSESCRAVIFDDGTIKFGASISGDSVYPSIVYGAVSVYRMKNNVFTYASSYTDSTYFNITGQTSLTMKSYIDTNINNFLSTYDFALTFGDYTYTIPKGTHFPSLYEFNEKLNSIPDIPTDDFLEEKEIMNNFYSTVFTKIGELSNNLANNYIFLLIFGIFILIFIFEIIRRRFI